MMGGESSIEKREAINTKTNEEKKAFFYGHMSPLLATFSQQRLLREIASTFQSYDTLLQYYGDTLDGTNVADIKNKGNEKGVDFVSPCVLWLGYSTDWIGRYWKRDKAR